MSATRRFTFVNHTDGLIHVHKAGCANLTGPTYNVYRINGSWDASAVDVSEAVGNEMEAFNADGMEFTEDCFEIFDCCRK